jgi:hypothetical protein
VLKDHHPKYEVAQATSCEQVLNINMKELKENLRVLLGGSKRAFRKVHGTYNPEETLMVLRPLGLSHLVPRKTFESFGELFQTLNNHPSLLYVVQRSHAELVHSPQWFVKRKDVDVLVSDYYCFKSITGARTLRPPKNQRIRGHDSGTFIQSKLIIGGAEVSFDIRYIGDKYLDPKWEHDLLQTRTLTLLPDGTEVYIPEKEHLLYSLAYNVIIQKKHPEKSKHLSTIRELGKDTSHIGNLYKDMKDWMNKKQYKFTKPLDRSVGFRIRK